MGSRIDRGRGMVLHILPSLLRIPLALALLLGGATVLFVHWSIVLSNQRFMDPLNDKSLADWAVILGWPAGGLSALVVGALLFRARPARGVEVAGALLLLLGVGAILRALDVVGRAAGGNH